VGDEAAAGERHGVLLLRPRRAGLAQLRTGGGAGQRYRSRLWHEGAQKLTSVVMGPGSVRNCALGQDDAGVCARCLAFSRRR
jgi:hypothetical protein